MTSPLYPVRGLSGCEPDKYSTNLLNINAGSVNAYDGSARYDFPVQTQINLAINGLWGFDIGSPTTGELYVYLISNLSTGDFGFIASSSKYQGGVAYPSGFTFARKLPWGVMYNPSWDGIPNFHLTHGNLPFIRLTDSQYGGVWNALTGGSAAAWTDIDLSSWLPDNARMAYINVEVRYNSGSAGSGFIRSYSGQTTGVLVGSGSPGSPLPGAKPYFIRTTSDRHIQYQCTGNVQMYVDVLGYSMTEPS